MRRKRNKEIQRERTMKLFIDSADEIIMSEGVESLSIRKVANCAGYNSATLYNYFDNLEHLVYFTYMKKVKAFYLIFSTTQDEQEALEDLKRYWLSLTKMCFHYPHEMKVLLYAEYCVQFQSILKDYLEIYSDLIDSCVAEKILDMFEEGLTNPLTVALLRLAEEFSLSFDTMNELKTIVETFLRGIADRQDSDDRFNSYETFLKISEDFIEKMIDVYLLSTAF